MDGFLMNSPNTDRVGQRRFTSPRIAQTVADELRRQIIDGELADGDLLPPQAVLVERFNVSLMALREALRILETEGLVSVRRGNRGGAMVHAPAKSSAAYMLALVLQSKDAQLSDLATALQEFEPICAGLCAQRDDRDENLVPQLEQLNTAMAENLGDGPTFTELGRQFHDLIVRGCGNHTVVAVVGSLEELWSGRERQWAARSSATGHYPTMRERQAVLKTHRAITDAIQSGNEKRAKEIAARHLCDTQTYVLTDEATQRIVATPPHTPVRAQGGQAL